jgi:hypothetical protein
VTPTVTPYRPSQQVGRDGFLRLLHAEWTKFRTVQGWVTGMVVAALMVVLFALLAGAGHRQLLLRTPAAGRKRRHHRLRLRAQEQHPSGPRGPTAWHRAVGEGRAHHQGEHPPGITLRGDHGYRQPRRADAGQLRQRRGRPPGPGPSRVPPPAAAGPLGRHDHRLCLHRRHEMDQGGHRAGERARTGPAGQAVRRLSACRGRRGHGRQCVHGHLRGSSYPGWAGGNWTGGQVGARSPSFAGYP